MALRTGLMPVRDAVRSPRWRSRRVQWQGSRTDAPCMARYLVLIGICRNGDPHSFTHFLDTAAMYEQATADFKDIRC
jgi:hypothetical protein